MKKLYMMLLCLSMVLGLFPTQTLAATAWPANVSIEAEGGIVMDADTGAVLYGKNLHIPYFPASITKILTALIVLERCGLDETVTFSHNAVYNVEANSTSAGLDEGDVLSVRDCLYTLLLKSANEVANALAEHVAGTTEDFAVLMNEKAASLGCVDSHFSNPSGLNDPNHYTSAYDMALIARAALQNPAFVEIDSTLYYDIPVTKRNPEGARVYPGHKMIKKNSAEYYPDAFGGKTGYTSLAGNTLVTFAKRDGMTLLSVILNGHQTHYSDTRKLLDFGFNNFQSVVAADYDRTYASVTNDMKIAGLSSSDLVGLTLDKNSKVTIPKGSDFSEITSVLSYDLTGTTIPERKIGSSYLLLQTSKTVDLSIPTTTIPAITGITLESSEAEKPPETTKQPFHIPSIVWTVLWVILVLGILITGIVLFKLHQEKKEAEARAHRRERRLKRLQDSNYSNADFDLMMAQRRSSYTSKRPTHSPHRKTHRKFPFFK
ncbi:MAG: D-alanyl-D-alanine carboxypeptidase family protein [Hungatella sp.]